jgi:hypothetical protein
MKLTIAAIKSGTDPVGALPVGAFHRWLEEPIHCPKCEVTYNLVVEWDQANDRFFEESSRQLIMLLKRTVRQGHDYGHRITHFETSGAVVRSYTKADQVIELKPRTPHIM